MLRKLTIEKLAFVSNNSHVQSTTSQAQITTSGTWLLSWICNDEYIYIESSS